MKTRLLILIAVVSSFSSFAQSNEKNWAIELVKKHKAFLGLSDSDVGNSIVSDSYFNKTAGTQMVYLQQSYLRIPVYNVMMTLAFKNDKPVSKSGGRIKNIQRLVNSTDGLPLIDAQIAVMAALSDRKIQSSTAPVELSSQLNRRKIIFNDMGVSRENITAELMWVPVEDNNKVVLCWQIYIVPNTNSDYWMVRVNAMDKTIAGFNNLTVYCNWEKHNNTANCIDDNDVYDKKENLLSVVSSSPTNIDNASYKVTAYPAESPLHPGGAPKVVTNPWEAAPGNATSLKWHSTGTVDYTITRGNNVWATEDRKGTNSGGNAANSGSTAEPLNFEFTPNFLLSPTQTEPSPNQQFSITNLFYWNNVLHDISYLYGFDEASGNFQVNNQGRGGRGNDPVLADAQDGSGNNNASFATPPDGASPRMQMYLWNGNPQKDGSVDNGIVSHEFAHGISIRLIGGPSQVGCISNDENMGEGWSDYYGIMFTQDWANSDLNTGFKSPRTIGTYAIGQNPGGNGLRTKKYCTNFAVNDKVYKTTIETQVHTRGELWCATLWDMTWNIINQTGKISPTLYDVNGDGGNTIALKLVTEGMKLLPCFPGFIDGRDAILKADEILYGGAYSCAIKEAFRRRGMGAYASQGSSTSVTDQTADFSSGDAQLILTQNISKAQEGEDITYTNTITAGICSGISNYVLTDTLPDNVSYVSGGNYDAAKRVVSFPVNIDAGKNAEYSFTVKVNNDSYFPTVNLFQDSITQKDFSDKWVISPATGNFWSVSNKRNYSPQSSYYSSDPINESNLQLTLKNPLALGTNPPKLTFRHWFNTEYTYDGGVLEISTDGGATWKDMQNDILEGDYTAFMDASTFLTKRMAWTGNSNNKFIKSVVNLNAYANKNALLRFRFISDLGTNLEGWYIDEICIKDEPLVEMKSILFNSNGKNILSADTATIILKKESCATAAITTQPKNINACIGSTATLNVIATGNAPQYRWQISKDKGITFNDLPGEINSSLILSGISSSDNLNQYRVIVENGCPSSVTSEVALLTIIEPVSINTQPDNATVCSGENTSFSIVTSSPTFYNWQISKDNGNSFSDLPNQNNATLVLNNVNATQNGEKYRVKINNCSTNDLISSAVILTVYPLVKVSTQPKNASVCLNSSSGFSAEASGNSIVYQWQVSADGGNSYKDIENANSNEYTITSATATMNNYRYRLKVTEAFCGSAFSDAAILTVSSPAQITDQPDELAVCEKTEAKFSVVAGGSSISYQWQVSSNSGNSFTDISNAKSNTLTIASATSSLNNNLYRVAIKQMNCGTILSDPALLTVNSLPSVSINASPASAVLPGQTITLTSSSSSVVNVYKWYLNGSLISNQTGNLIVVGSDKLGIYTLTVSDANGCSSSSQAINVKDSILSSALIYPNPNAGKFQIREASFSADNKGRKLNVYDSKGALVYTKEYSVNYSYQPEEIILEKLKNGLYLAALYDSRGRMLKSERLLIIR